MIVIKGTGAHMLKIGSKRRRTKQEMDTQRLVAEQDRLDIQQKLAELDAIKAERDQLAQRIENNGAAADILTGLISKRHVMQNPDGSCYVPSVENSMVMP